MDQMVPQSVRLSQIVAGSGALSTAKIGWLHDGASSSAQPNET
jgi:hypothetical protein